MTGHKKIDILLRYMEKSVKKTNFNGYEVYNIISILNAFEKGSITDEVISEVLAPFSNEKETLHMFNQSMAGHRVCSEISPRI